MLRGILAVSILLATGGPALAGGFEIPAQGTRALGRGGAFTVKADDPSAMHWNPGKLSLLRGTRLLYDHNIKDLRLTYHRAPVETDDGWHYFDGVEEEGGFFPLGISFFLTSDFGLEDWTFGLGVVGPNAIGTSSFPDDPDSPTRYAFLSKDVLMIYYTASVAYQFEQLFGLGVSLQYVDMQSMKFRMVMNGNGKPNMDPVKNGWDIESTLNLSDRVGFTALVGLWVRPLPCLELAATARVLPVWFDAKGKATLKGTSNSTLSTAPSAEVDASVKFELPASLQLGARYAHMDGDREVFDIELDFVWENWAALDSFDVSFRGDAVQFITTDGNIALEFEPTDFKLDRNYQDTYSVRLGGDWNAVPDHLTVRLGGYWESGAMPVKYTNVDFASYDRLGAAFGLTGRFYGVELGFAYAHVFQLPRDVHPNEAAVNAKYIDTVTSDVMDGPAVNAGFYESSYDIISFSLAIHWDELVAAFTGDE